jgi:REP element-mobilizing transposase RayT
MTTDDGRLRYTFAFCTYRRGCVIEDAIGSRLQEQLSRLAAEFDADLLDIGCAADSVLIRVAAPPTIAPTDLALALKEGSERTLRAEFRQLRAVTALWTSGYLVTTDPRPDSDRLARFVEEERDHESGLRVIITAPPWTSTSR